MENIVKAVCNVAEVNKAIKHTMGCFPDELPKGSVVDLYITGIYRENIDQLVRLYLDYSYVSYNNEVKFNILTKKGFVAFNNDYVRNILTLFEVKVINLDIPTKVYNRYYNPIEGVNFKVFKGQLKTLEKLLKVNMTSECYEWKKPASSYTGDFLGKSSKDDGGELVLSIKPWAIKLPIVVNFKSKFINDDVNNKTPHFIATCVNSKKIYYAFNGVLVKYPVIRENIDNAEKLTDLVSIVKYLFDCNEDIFYTQDGKFTTSCIIEIAKDIAYNKQICWFVNKYDKEEFIENLNKFLSITVGNYNDVVSDIVKILNNKGAFTEESRLFEDTYNDDYDSIEDEYFIEDENIIDYDVADEDEGEDEEDE